MNAPCEVLILAGDRGPDDPVARSRGVPGKVLAKVGGRPMLARVLEAVAQCDGLGRIHLLGPDFAHSRLVEPIIEPWQTRLQWHAPGPGPSASVAAALSEILPGRPVLLTTGDHALLQPAILRDFVDAATASGAEACVALVPWALVSARFPDTRRTRYRFRDGQFCGANLFWFSGNAAASVAERWRQVERNRKRPWRVARVLGYWNLLRFVLGRLGLQHGFEQLSRRLDVIVRPVVLQHAEAAVDVDSLADLALVEQALAARQAAGVAR